MRKVLLVANQEFRTMLRHPFYLIATILLPVLGFLAVIGFMVFQSVTSDKEPEAAKVGYVDNAAIVSGFREQGRITFVPFSSEDEAWRALSAGEIERYYVIPSDYLKTGLVSEYSVEKGFFPSETSQTAVRDLLLANVLALSDLQGVPPEVLSRIRQPIFVDQVRLDPGGEVRPPPDYGSYAFFFVLSILLLMSLFTSAGTLLQGLGEEKENRIIEVLLSSVSPGQLMTGKILGLGASGLVQMVIWTAAGFGILGLASGQIPAFSQVTLPGASALLGILYFVLGYMLFGTVFACVGALTPTAREGNQFVPIFVIPAIIPFYASVAIQGDPTGLFSRVLTFFPLSSPVAVLMRLAASGIDAWEIALSATILATAALGALWVAGRLFGAYILMYGKRPSMKEVWRALRGTR